MLLENPSVHCRGLRSETPEHSRTVRNVQGFLGEFQGPKDAWITLNELQSTESWRLSMWGCGCIFGEDRKIFIFLADSGRFVPSRRRWAFLFSALGASAQEGHESSIHRELLAEPWAASIGEALQRAFPSYSFFLSCSQSLLFLLLSFFFLVCLFNSEKF